MAEAFFNYYSKKYKAESAALIKPQDKMHKLVVRAMKEEGLDISKNISKKITEKMLKEADIIIFMSENLESYLSEFKYVLKPDAKIEIWNVPDVIAKETDLHSYPEIVKTRNVIKQKVNELIEKIS